MLFTQFGLYVSYRQLCVFDAEMENPFNEWTPQHSAQGFSWRPGSVSFGTLVESGDARILIHLGPGPDPDSGIIRAIRVPFRVPESGIVEVASIEDSTRLELPNGEYELTFQTGRSDGTETITLVFERKSGSTAEIVIRDSKLQPRYPLLMDANPAG